MSKIIVKDFTDIKEGDPIVFFGVHVLRWDFAQWGDPTIAIDIVEDEQAEKVLNILHRCADHLLMDIDRDGKGISCTDTPETLTQIRELIAQMEE